MKQRVYVGTYSQKEPASRGIYLYEFDSDSGALSLIDAFASVDPSFLTTSADRRFLYAVNELNEFAGKPGGGVSAYAVDAAGRLSFLNTQPTHGAHPCHITIDPSGKWALVSNYSGGNLTILPIGADGRLGEPKVTQHGKGAHVHSAIFDPTGQLVLVADLGLDQIFVYRFNAATGAVTPHQQASLRAAKGAGPRHQTFDPSGKTLYCINELDSTVSVYRFDAASLRFEPVQTISSVPEGYQGQKWSADIHVSPDGKYLYASNRAHNSIVQFAIDGASGKLTQPQWVSSGGEIPRNFAFDLSGTYVLAANQDSSLIMPFKVDGATGKLTPTGQGVGVPFPVCVMPVQI
jgi:6-phosphogluconolactonase